MSSLLAFSPTAATLTIAASTSSGSGTLAGSTTVPSSMRVYNGTSASVAFIKYGTGAQTATAADFPVAPGVTEVINIPPGVDTVAVILSAATGNVYFTRGGGL